MILKDFKSGWQEKYEERIQRILTMFPNASIKRVHRFFGTLQIDFESLDNDAQFILDCISYKIARTSGKICESCGNGTRGIKKDDRLPEPMSLCWKCYALEIDSWESRNRAGQIPQNEE